jgi:co-chaperonin GroES (HSP10)
MPSTAMFHENDPKEALLQKVGDLSSVEVFGSDVLLAIYQRPEKTASGIILTDNYRDEDKWQGKTHLVLKMGPTAFVDDDGEKFRDVAEGDWVVIRPSDGQLVTLNTLKRSNLSKDDTVLCRIADAASIRMRVTHPDAIW